MVDAARSFGIDGLIPFLDPLSPFFLVRAYPDPIDISLHCRDSLRAGGVTDASLCPIDVNRTYINIHTEEERKKYEAEEEKKIVSIRTGAKAWKYINKYRKKREREDR